MEVGRAPSDRRMAYMRVRSLNAVCAQHNQGIRCVRCRRGKKVGGEAGAFSKKKATVRISVQMPPTNYEEHTGI